MRLWETPNKQWSYILPLQVFFYENEIIQIINVSLYCKIIYQGLSTTGDPIIVFHKYNVLYCGAVER